jgi:hypothetical protein
MAPGHRPETIAYVPVVSTDSDNVPVAGGYVGICGSTAFCDGFEGIDTAAHRNTVMGRMLEHLLG